MKKIIKCIFALVLTIGLLTGCSKAATYDSIDWSGYAKQYAEFEMEIEYYCEYGFTPFCKCTTSRLSDANDYKSSYECYGTVEIRNEYGELYTAKWNCIVTVNKSTADLLLKDGYTEYEDLKDALDINTDNATMGVPTR